MAGNQSNASNSAASNAAGASGSVAAQSAGSSPSSSMPAGLGAIGLYFAAWGAIELLLALSSSAGADARSLLLLLGPLHLVVGVGLLKRRYWAYVGALILAAITLLTAGNGSGISVVVALLIALYLVVFYDGEWR